MEFEEYLLEIQVLIAKFLEIHANPYDTSKHNETAEKLKKIAVVLKKHPSKLKNNKIVDNPLFIVKDEGEMVYKEFAAFEEWKVWRTVTYVGNPDGDGIKYLNVHEAPNTKYANTIYDDYPQSCLKDYYDCKSNYSDCVKLATIAQSKAVALGPDVSESEAFWVSWKKKKVVFEIDGEVKALKDGEFYDVKKVTLEFKGKSHTIENYVDSLNNEMKNIAGALCNNENATLEISGNVLIGEHEEWKTIVSGTSITYKELAEKRAEVAKNLIEWMLKEWQKEGYCKDVPIEGRIKITKPSLKRIKNGDGAMSVHLRLLN